MSLCEGDVEDYEISEKTRIDGSKMVNDLHFLYRIDDIELPLHINRNWHPEIAPLYKEALSGEARPYKTTLKPYYRDYYVYERDPIDVWDGYTCLF